MTDIAKLEAKLASLNEQRTELFKKQAPINAALTKNYNEIEKVQNQIADLKYADVKAVNADWADVLHTTGNDGMTRYRAAERLLTELGVRMGGGMLRESQQRVVCISLSRKATPERRAEVKKALETLLPVIIPIEIEGEKVKYIDIFEHTLSEYGIYFAGQVVETGKWKVYKTTYGSTRELEELNSLDDFLMAVQTRYWYDGWEDDDED
jgi:hypothetical protein